MVGGGDPGDLVRVGSHVDNLAVKLRRSWVSSQLDVRFRFAQAVRGQAGVVGKVLLTDPDQVNFIFNLLICFHFQLYLHLLSFCICTCCLFVFAPVHSEMMLAALSAAAVTSPHVKSHIVQAHAVLLPYHLKFKYR